MQTWFNNQMDELRGLPDAGCLQRLQVGIIHADLGEIRPLALLVVEIANGYRNAPKDKPKRGEQFSLVLGRAVEKLTQLIATVEAGRNTELFCGRLQVCCEVLDAWHAPFRGSVMFDGYSSYEIQAALVHVCYVLDALPDEKLQRQICRCIVEYVPTTRLTPPVAKQVAKYYETFGHEDHRTRNFLLRFFMALQLVGVVPPDELPQLLPVVQEFWQQRTPACVS